MQILAVNLAKELVDAIVCELGEVVCSAHNFEEASAQIQQEDFSIILYAVTEETFDRSILDALVGLTLISTRIILLGENRQLARYDGWQELGIEFIHNPSLKSVICKIQGLSAHMP